MRDEIARLTAECAKLRAAMHDAPMNKMFRDHTGHRHLGTHSTAWADRSREWCRAKDRLDALLAKHGGVA